MKEKYVEMGKECILCFICNNLKACFGLMGAGSHAAFLDHEKKSYFNKSDEMYYYREVTELLKSYKKADYILPPYRREFINILRESLPGLKEVMDDCASLQILSRKRWGNILKEFSEYAKEALNTLD